MLLFVLFTFKISFIKKNCPDNLNYYTTNVKLRFCAGSNPARGVSEIRDGEDL